MVEDIQQDILENIENLSNIPEETYETMDTAIAILSLSLPNNMIIIGAAPQSTPLAEIFSEQIDLAFPFSSTPSLNTYLLSSNAHKLNYLYQNLGVHESLKLEFEAIFKEGSSLLLISDNQDDSLMFSELIKSAQTQNCPIIAIGTGDDQNLKDMLNDEDIFISLPVNNASYFMALAITILNSFAKLLTGTIIDDLPNDE